METEFRLLHPSHVLRPTDKQETREDFLDECADLRKCEPWSCAGPQALGLEKRKGDGADHHVVLPAGIRPPFEVVEAEF